MAIRTTHGIGGMLPWQRTLSTLLNNTSLLVKQRQLHQLVLHWVRLVSTSWASQRNSTLVRLIKLV